MKKKFKRLSDTSKSDSTDGASSVGPDLQTKPTIEDSASNKTDAEVRVDQTQSTSEKTQHKRFRRSIRRGPNTKESSTSSSTTVKLEEHSVAVPQNAVSSSVTPTKLNTLSNYALTDKVEKLITYGWSELSTNVSIFKVLQDSFNQLGLPTIIWDSNRDEPLRRFKDWSSLIKARVNASSNVYVLDAENVDKSLSSEKLFISLYQQRKPFSKMLYGTPDVSANVLPDINYNLKLLNFTSNTFLPGAPQYVKEALVYAKLVQNQNQNQNVWNRAITIDSSISNNGNVSKGSIMTTFSTYVGNNNQLSTGIYSENNIRLGKIDFAQSITDGAGLVSNLPTVSKELLNKVKYFRKLYNVIHSEAANYASDLKSGDNAWFEPATLIQDIPTLAATINATMDLKTMLYIINDAIHGAFRSQLIKATKLGTPDSTYVSLVERSKVYLQMYDNAYSYLWSALKPLPLNRDVINVWNKHKNWSKFTKESLYNNDNMLMIPIFLLSRTGGMYYKPNKSISNKTDNTLFNGMLSLDDIKDNKLESIVPSDSDLTEQMILTAATLDRSSIAIPHGDWCSIFLQTILFKLSINNFIPNNRNYSSTLVSGNSDADIDELTPLTLVNTMKEFFNDAANAKVISSLVIPVNDMTYNSADLLISQPKTNSNNGQLVSTNNTMLGLQDFGSDHILYGDYVISYHTMTGFMMAFMDAIVNEYNSGKINLWRNLAMKVAPYYNRISSLLNEKDQPITYGDEIEYVSVSSPPSWFSEEPSHNIDQNIDFYYQNNTLDLSVNDSGSFYYYPTRLNHVTTDMIQNFGGNTYKMFGYRKVMINKDGVADRDIYLDNTIATVQSANGNFTTLQGNRNSKIYTVYQTSYIISRITDYLPTNSNNYKRGLFPVYVGDHVGSCFQSYGQADQNNTEVPYKNSTNFYMKGGYDLKPTTLLHRPFIVNTSDSIYITQYPGAFDQLIYSQVVGNAMKFLSETGVLVSSVLYVPNSMINYQYFDMLNTVRLMSQFNNYSTAQILDYTIDKVFDRVDLNSPYSSEILPKLL